MSLLSQNTIPHNWASCLLLLSKAPVGRPSPPTASVHSPESLVEVLPALGSPPRSSPIPGSSLELYWSWNSEGRSLWVMTMSYQPQNSYSEQATKWSIKNCRKARRPIALMSISPFTLCQNLQPYCSAAAATQMLLPAIYNQAWCRLSTPDAPSE